MTDRTQSKITRERAVAEIQLVAKLKVIAGQLMDAGFTSEEVASAFMSTGAALAARENGRAMAVEWLRFVADQVERPIRAANAPH